MGYKTHVLFSACFLVVLISFTSVYGEVNSLTTDKTSYFKGDKIIFSGSVDLNDTGKQVNLQISGPQGNFLGYFTGISDSSGFYKIIVDTNSSQIQGKFSQSGLYRAVAFLHIRSNGSTSFTFSTESSPHSRPQFSQNIQIPIQKNVQSTDKSSSLAFGNSNSPILKSVQLGITPGILQLEVDEKHKMGYANVLRYLGRSNGIENFVSELMFIDLSDNQLKIVNKLYFNELLSISYDKSLNKLYGITMDGGLTIIDTNTNKILKIMNLNETFGQALSSLDSTVNRLYVNDRSGILTVFDTKQDKIINKIPVSGQLQSLGYSEKRHYFYAIANSKIFVFDYNGNSITNIAITGENFNPAILVDNKNDLLYAANYKGDVFVVNTQTNSITNVINIPSVIATYWIIDENTGSIFYAPDGKCDVYKVDIKQTTNQLYQEGLACNGLTYSRILSIGDIDRLYYASQSNGIFSIFDLKQMFQSHSNPIEIVSEKSSNIEPTNVNVTNTQQSVQQSMQTNVNVTPQSIQPIQNNVNESTVQNKIKQIISSRDEFYNNNDNVHTLIYKGNAFFVASRFVDAFNYFDKALSKDPTNSEALDGKNKAYNQIHQFVSNIVNIDENTDKTDTNLMSSKGLLLAQLQDFDDSLSICNSALQLSPENYNAMECKLAALYGLGKYDDMDKFIQNSSTSSSSLVGLQAYFKIFTLYHLEKYDELTSYLDTVSNLAMNGNSYGSSYDSPYGSSLYGYSTNQAATVGFLAFKAAVAEKAGKTDLANSYYSILTSSLGVDPNAIKGRLFFFLRDYDKAVFYLEKAPYDQNIGYLKVIAYDEIARDSAAYKVQNALEHVQTDENQHKFCFLFWCF